MLETFAVQFGNTPTFLYFYLYLNTAYATHYVLCVYEVIDHNFSWICPGYRGWGVSIFDYMNHFQTPKYLADNKIT